MHAAFALPAEGAAGARAMLFLGGELLRAVPGGRAAAGVAGADDPMLAVGTGGAGRIAHAIVLAEVISPQRLEALVRAESAASMAALAASGDALAVVLLAGGGSGAEVDRAVQALSSAVAALNPARAVHSLSSGVAVAELTGRALPPSDGTLIKPVLVPAAAGHLRGGQAEAGSAAAASAAASSTVPDALRRAPGSIAGSGAGNGRVDYSGGGNQWVSVMMRASAASASGSVTDAAALAAGTFTDDVTAAELTASDALGRVRAESVKGAMVHAWTAYRERAWGSDELKPRSGVGQDNWAGIGMTLLDSLDTLWLMGMDEEFAEAREWVATKLTFDRTASVSVFETTIRALGGLLAAYDLSGDDLFLDKARDLGSRLLGAFESPTGIPRSSIILSTGAASSLGWTGGASILSELGTLQVEFRRLGAAAGEARFARKAEAVIERLEGLRPPDGLYPIYISADSGAATSSQVTFGALGDSFFEYLVKVWVQGGRVEPMYRRLYDEAMEGMSRRMLKRSHPSNLLYVADWDGANTHDKMDHLVCFVPGMLALGAFTARGTPGEARAAADLERAKALAYTCYQMYARQATGLAAEYVDFPGGADLVPAPNAAFYILRPEAAESLFILHQLTGNPIYREWGWTMFQAIEKYCRVEFGYGAHPDVRDTSRTPDDRMER